MTAPTEGELDLLTDACRKVHLTTKTYLADDYVATLLETVIDYQQQPTTVLKAIEHSRNHRWDEIRTHADLTACLARFPDDRDGNMALAQHLWGYRLWPRAAQLRRLVEFFGGLNVTTFQDLQRWAHASTFDDFRGEVPGLGYVLYQWLIMRLGVETVKPDSRILAFIRRAIGRDVWETEAVAALEEVARRLNIKANVLDWSIWDAEKT